LVFTAPGQSAAQATRIAKPGAYLGPLKRVLTLPNGGKQLELDFPGKFRVVPSSAAAIEASDQAVPENVRRLQQLYIRDKQLSERLALAASLIAQAKQQNKNVSTLESQATTVASNVGARAQGVLAFLGVNSLNGLGALWVPVALAAGRSAIVSAALPALWTAMQAGWRFFATNTGRIVVTAAAGASALYAGQTLASWIFPNEKQQAIDTKTVDEIIKVLETKHNIKQTPELRRDVESAIVQHGEATADNVEQPGLLSNLSKSTTNILIAVGIVGGLYVLSQTGALNKLKRK
jgi:hypothetical protein